MMRNEKFIEQIDFKTIKFGTRPRPTNKKKIVIIPMFSEFGCETLGAVYCLPAVLKMLSGRYFIILGWHGREYFYRHLVDEYWELDKSHMWLREYAQAFHHASRNLQKVEKWANQFGQVLDCGIVANVAVFPKLNKCLYCEGNVFRGGNYQRCSKCEKVFPDIGLFSEVDKSFVKAQWLPAPSQEKMEWARKFVPPNAIGIIARQRQTWGRNFNQGFYEQLIYLVEDLGYVPIWIGEKVSTLSCPLSRTLDYSSLPQADDLEQTFAVVSLLKTTIQYYTASTRLASMLGVPYLLFESPEQLFGTTGQEGYRLDLLTRGPRKLVISDYKVALERQDEVLRLTEIALQEMENNNYMDIIDLVQNVQSVYNLRRWRKLNVN